MNINEIIGKKVTFINELVTWYIVQLVDSDYFELEDIYKSPEEIWGKVEGYIRNPHNLWWDCFTYSSPAGELFEEDFKSFVEFISTSY